MTVDSERVREVFLIAANLRTEDRARFLDDACANEFELREKVEGLLPHHDDTDLSLEPSDSGAADQNGPLAALVRSATPPERIGSYRILEVLGTGGMGIVYLAEQSRPQRQVALKVVRSGLVSARLLKRFVREAEVLASLQHVGIAQVFEAGTFGEGPAELPFFAMELIDGPSILDFARDQELNTRERLELFTRVCDAIDHAHEQGVIHRDLKPSNILVNAHGQPKVLDFGVARAADSQQEVSMRTKTGQLVGTLPYMSPEQVSGDSRDLDHRTDVYALGVLLYELLSGELPLDFDALTHLDAARKIHDVDAPLLGALGPEFRGDVETIVAKALRKERKNRYATARALAEDVHHYLRNEPIEARPASTLYQLRKYTRRHRGLVAGLSIAFVALVVGLAFSLNFALDEARQRRMAEFAGYRALLAAAMAALDDGDLLVARALLDEAPEALRGWEWHHAAARAEPLLWQIELGLTLPKPWSQVFPVAVFSSYEDLLAVLVADDRIDVFEAETGAHRHSIELSGPLNRNCLAATATGFVTITVDGHVAHWDGATGELLEEDVIPGPPIRMMAWDETNRRLAAANVNDTGEEAWLHVGPIGSIQTVKPGDTGRAARFPIAWTDNGKTLVAMPDRGGGVTLADLVMDDTGEPTLSLRASLDVNRVFAKHEDRLLVIPTGGKTDKLVVIDLNGDELLQLDPQLQPNVMHGAFSGDGRRIVTTSIDGAHRIVTVYDAASGHAIARWPGAHWTVSTLSPTGRLLAIGTADRLAVMSLDSPATTVLPGADDYIYSLAWTPDSRVLWARNFNMSSRGYDVVEGTVLLDLPSPGRPLLWSVTNFWGLSADGRRLVATNHMPDHHSLMRFSTHDLVSGGHWREVPGVSGEATESLLLSDPVNMTRTSRLEFLLATGAIGPSDLPPEDQLLVGPLARTLERVDGTGQVPLLIGGRALPEPGADNLVKHLDTSFSPDGKFLAAVRPSVHEGAVVHDVTTGDSVAELLTGNQTGVLLYAVAFSPDGRRLAVAGTDRVVSLFDTSNWQLVTRLEGHLGYIKDIAWSPDGNTLATAGGDGTVRLWSTSPLAKRTAAAHAAAARRDQQRPSVAALFEQLDDPYAVAEAVRADTSRDDDQRYAALRVVRELADAWWATREGESGDR